MFTTNQFAPMFQDILDSLEKQGANLAPTFGFIDPFGFSGLPMTLIARMLKCKKCEVLITFMSGFVRRFNDDLREDALNELYATDEWKQIRKLTDPEEREKFVLQLYERQLKKLGEAEFVKSFGMKGNNNQTIYYLVFATKHLKGLEVMKGAMWKVDQSGEYKFSDVTGFNQSLLMGYLSEPFWIEKAANLVFKKFKGRTVNERDVYRFVIADTQYMYKKAILQLLEKSNPPKILKVANRQKAYSYPDGCCITFSKE